MAALAIARQTNQDKIRERTTCCILIPGDSAWGCRQAHHLNCPTTRNPKHAFALDDYDLLIPREETVATNHVDRG
jgi:hypothetical protein